MIDIAKIHTLEFFKAGGVYTGTDKMLRYKISRIGEKPDFQLEGRIWKGPFASDVQPEEAFTIRTFAFSEEGKAECVQWMNEEHESHPEKWED